MTGTNNNLDEYDLEASLMSCWQTADDLTLIADQLAEQCICDDATRVAALVRAAADIHTMRMQKAWNIFERVSFPASKNVNAGA